MRGGPFSRWWVGVRPVWIRLAGARGQRNLRRLAGLALVAGFCALLVQLWHPVYHFTPLLQVDRHNEPRLMPALRARPVALNDGGYDGQYYAQLACDPTLRSPALPAAIDSLSYRARRILLPAVAWLLGFGDPGRAVAIYPWLNIACWLVLAGLLWSLLEVDQHWRGLLAWGGVMFSAGSLASVRYSLTDLPALLLLVLAVRAARGGREGWMAAWLGAGLLTRETMFAGAWGLCAQAWEWSVRWRRGVLWLALAIVPYVVWMVYIRYRVGQMSEGIGNFAMPFAGLVKYWRDSVGWLRSCPDPWLAWWSLLALVGGTAQLLFVVSHVDVRDRWWRLGAGFALLMLVLGHAVWEGYLGATTRVLLPLLLACNVMALRSRWAWGWLLLLNLSVPGGLADTLVRPDPRTFATARSGAAAAVLEIGTGCYGIEGSRRDRWTWADQEAECRVRSWDLGGGASIAAVITIRSPDSRELAISCGGRELWRGQVGRDWRTIRLHPLPVGGDWAVLRFQATTAGAHEPGDPRALSVCLLNPQLELEPR